MTTPLVSAFQTIPVTTSLGPVIGVANGDLAVRQQIDGRLRFTGGAEQLNANLDVSGKYPAVHPPAHQFLELFHRSALSYLLSHKLQFAAFGEDF